jgi:hypothetical protein
MAMSIIARHWHDLLHRPADGGWLPEGDTVGTTSEKVGGNRCAVPHGLDQVP